MTTQRLRVSGFVIVDVSYEVEMDVPAAYAGREIEYLVENGLLPELQVVAGIYLTTNKAEVEAVKWDIKPDSFKPAVAEVISD